MAQGTVGVNILSNVVSIGGSNVGAFGDLITAQLTPVVQLDFVYGINTQTGTSTTANSATVDTDASRLRIQSGVNAAGAATFQSSAIARYRQGEGMVARFTGVWTTSAADSTQVIGVGNTQVGYFFGYNGITFSISRRNGGADNWVAQTAWNGDKCDGTGGSGFNWNKTFGNILMITYPYLGYGSVKFWVQNPITGGWILCHTIEYSNSSASVQVSNSSFPFYANATNAGSTTNLIMYTGSVGIFISGQREYLGAQFALDNVKTVTTEACILNLRNATTYNGVINTGVVRLRSLTCAMGGTSNPSGVVRFKKAVTIGGSPSWAAVSGTTGDSGVTITSGQSVVSVDTAGTTVTGGTYIYNLAIAVGGNSTVDLTSYNIFISPTEILTISGYSTSSAPIQVGINWNEDS